MINLHFFIVLCYLLFYVVCECFKLYNSLLVDITGIIAHHWELVSDFLVVFCIFNILSCDLVLFSLILDSIWCYIFLLHFFTKFT